MKQLTRRVLVAIVLVGFATIVSWPYVVGRIIPQPVSLRSVSISRPDVPTKTAKVIGRASCSVATCHGAVIDRGPVWHWSATVWEAKDPHRLAGQRLYSDVARQIVHALDQDSKNDSHVFDQVLVERCVGCHAPESASERSWSQQLAHGVGCEACHGAAESWLEQHTAADWPLRRQSGTATGMLDTRDALTRIENCGRCHLGSRTADGIVRDVTHELLAAGHPRLMFDPSVMESRLPAHWETGPNAAIHSLQLHRHPQTVARRGVQYVFERLKAERRLPGSEIAQPEFSEYACTACHRWIEAEVRTRVLR